jgi:hypothetical protein
MYISRADLTVERLVPAYTYVGGYLRHETCIIGRALRHHKGHHEPPRLVADPQTKRCRDVVPRQVQDQGGVHIPHVLAGRPFLKDHLLITPINPVHRCLYMYIYIHLYFRLRGNIAWFNFWGNIRKGD